MYPMLHITILCHTALLFQSVLYIMWKFYFASLFAINSCAWEVQQACNFNVHYNISSPWYVYYTRLQKLCLSRIFGFLGWQFFACEWTKFQDENKIMLMDLTNCTDVAKEYFIGLQHEILARRRRDGATSAFGARTSADN